MTSSPMAASTARIDPVLLNRDGDRHGRLQQQTQCRAVPRLNRSIWRRRLRRAGRARRWEAPVRLHPNTHPRPVSQVQENSSGDGIIMLEQIGI